MSKDSDLVSATFSSVLSMVGGVFRYASEHPRVSIVLMTMSLAQAMQALDSFERGVAIYNDGNTTYVDSVNFGVSAGKAWAILLAVQKEVKDG